ncbi:MAG TPA: ribose 5-phosphate isomerase B [Candidatus Atribacteria bacterium]|nr:ribose 5-phosphate isomerase B [Candidatus Atribacteria bacterium]
MTDSINRIKIIQNVVSGLYSTAAPEKIQPIPNNVRDKVGCVAIGSDHGGFEAKEIIRDYLRTIGYRVTDVGTFSKDSVDYPDFALKVARKVTSGECDRGIMIDGAGIGSSMVCNKVKGIRAALCYNQKTIINSREHNNANVLTLGGPLHTPDELREMVKLWLETSFAGGRHWKRVNKIMAAERNK